jgi:hypothetical protein
MSEPTNTRHRTAQLAAISSVRVVYQLCPRSCSIARACIIASRGDPSRFAASRGANPTPPGHRAC